MKLTSVVVSLLAACAMAPVTASAQFTTFVSPGRAKADSAKQVVAAATAARTDSTARMTLTNMKAWVDSASGVAVAPSASTDTAAAVASSTAPAPGQQVATPATTSFANGAVAPNTASILPLLLLVGAFSTVAGVLVLLAEHWRNPTPTVADRWR